MSILEETESPGLVRTLAGSLLQRRATWVLVDQAVVSLGNFLTAVFLARRLSQVHYGAFGVLLETMLFLNSLQAALVIYPLTIRGATGGRQELGRTATAAMGFTLFMLPLLGIVLCASTWFIGMAAVATSAVAAMLLWQMQETLRRALMADLRFADAVWGDGIRYLGQGAAIYLLYRWDQLSLTIAFVVMAATSTAAMLVQAWQVGPHRVHLADLRAAAGEFWRLGRWMLLSNLSSLVTGLGYIWMLQWSHGLAASGVFAAIVQVFKLANPVMASMNGLIMPAVARASATGGSRDATRQALRYIAFAATLLLPYFLVLALVPGLALQLIYGRESPYVAHAMQLRLFVANYIAIFVLSMTGAWLAGLGRSRSTFHVQIVNMIASVLVGLPLTALFGVTGLIIGGLVAASSGAAVSAYLVHQATRSAGVSKATI